MPVAEPTEGDRGHGGPGRRRAALGRAVVLREALFRLFSAVAAGAEPDDADIAALSRLCSPSGMRHLALGDLGCRPTWTGLDLPAWEAAADAVALLYSPARAVGQAVPRRHVRLGVRRREPQPQ